VAVLSARGISVFAAVLFVAGLAIGSAGDRPIASPPPVMDGFIVLAGDLHVHSFPGDGALAPWDLAHEARRRRLDFIGLTNHNAMLSWDLLHALPWVPTTPGVILVPGVEVTAVGFHIAAIGMRSPVDWRGTPVDAIARIHAQDALAIAAHPIGDRDPKPLFDAAAVDVLDGVEAAHPGMLQDETYLEAYRAFYAAAAARHPSIAAIGSSDFHTMAPLGVCHTYAFVRAATVEGILEAIRAGRTVACDANGDAYGPAQLVSLVGDRCRAEAGAPPAGDPTLTRLGAAVAWLGLLAWLLCDLRV
jgi:hypothetical protein